MKFLSVFVSAILCSVTIAYPDQSSQRFSSAQVKNSRSVDEVPNKYIQHGYTQNEPVPVSAGNDPSTYLNTQNIHTSKSEPSTVQYGNRIDPGFPYQNPQNLRNEVQRRNPPIRRREYQLSPRGPAIHHIISNPKLRAFYAALKPTTQYTIIHPNGTIEYTNELRSVAARHPNYVMVKAKDILANIDHANKIGKSNATALHSVQNSLTKSSISASQGNRNEQYNSSANANAVPLKPAVYQPQDDLKVPDSELQKPPRNIQPPTFNDRENAVAANPLPVYPIQSSPITTVSDKAYVSPAVAEATSSSASPPKQNHEIKLKNNDQDIIYSPPVIETIKEASVTPSVVSSITDNKEKQSYTVDYVPIQSNPTPTKTPNQIEIVPIVLPKVPSQESLTEVEMPSPVDKLDRTAKNNANITNITQDTIKKNVNSKENTSFETPPNQNPINKPKNKDQNVIYNPPVMKNTKEASVIPTFDSTLNNNREHLLNSDNLPPNPTTTTQQIPSQVEILPIILPAEPSQKTLTEVEVPSPALQDKNNKGTNQATTFDIKDNSEQNSNTTEIVNSGTEPTPINNTDTVIENVTNTGIKTLNKTSSVVNDSSSNSTEAPWTWFNFSDETFWEAIRNNSNNVYFFFMPPKPKVLREIKTTIFPNGTTLEEITETVSDPDGEPKETKTTRFV